MRSLLISLLLAVPIWADELKAFDPSKVMMMVPKAPAPKTLPAAPAPSRATITPEVRYYIDSPYALLVTSSPPGYFEAVEKKGPLTVITKFADDPTVIAEKEFKGPYIYWLKPSASGPCEILAIPVMNKRDGDKQFGLTASDIHRQMVLVSSTKEEHKDEIKVDPKVDPSGPPIAGDGLQVLIKYNDKINMPEDVFTTIYGPKVTAWMNANVAKGPTGEPERRIWPMSTNTSQAPKKWQDAMKRPSSGDWWVIISNGITGTEQKLPIGEDAFIQLLNQYKR